MKKNFPTYILFFAVLFSLCIFSFVHAEDETLTTAPTEEVIVLEEEVLSPSEETTTTTEETVEENTTTNVPEVSESASPAPVFAPVPVEVSTQVYPRIIGQGPTGIPVPRAPEVYRIPAPPPEQAVLGEKIFLIDSLIEQTHAGEYSQKVVELQNELKELRFFPFTIPSTGWYGPVTKAAVEKYLASKQTDGKVLGLKLVNLDELLANIKNGERSNAVKQVQDELKRRKLFPTGIPSTGWYGPITKSAVEKYLASKNS